LNYFKKKGIACSEFIIRPRKRNGPQKTDSTDPPARMQCLHRRRKNARRIHVAPGEGSIGQCGVSNSTQSKMLDVWKFWSHVELLQEYEYDEGGANDGDNSDNGDNRLSSKGDTKTGQFKQICNSCAYESRV
jgi:hypothetical protein